MPKLLIIDQDRQRATELLRTFERNNFQVSDCTVIVDGINRIHKSKDPFDVIVFGLPSGSSDAWNAVSSIPKLTSAINFGTAILCVAQRYLGPKIRLAVEQLGGRLVYERPI